jgi:hypothetical protein
MKFSTSKLALLGVLGLVVLTGCDSSSDGEDAMLGMERRLLVAESGEASLRVLDVEDGEEIANLALAGPIRAYMLVEETGRYAFLAPTNGPVQTVDGGAFVDNGRLVEQAPSVHSFNVPGDNLIHLTHAHGLLAGFYDGTGEARFFRTQDVVRGGSASVTTVSGVRAHHGVGIAIGPDHVLVSSKTDDSPGLPSSVTGHTLPSGEQVFATADCCTDRRTARAAWSASAARTACWPSSAADQT